MLCANKSSRTKNDMAVHADQHPAPRSDAATTPPHDGRREANLCTTFFERHSGKHVTLSLYAVSNRVKGSDISCFCVIARCPLEYSTGTYDKQFVQHCSMAATNRWDCALRNTGGSLSLLSSSIRYTQSSISLPGQYQQQQNWATFAIGFSSKHYFNSRID